MVRIYAASRARRRAPVIASLHKRFCYKRYLFHVYTAVINWDSTWLLVSHDGELDQIR